MYTLYVNPAFAAKSNKPLLLVNILWCVEWDVKPY